MTNPKIYMNKEQEIEMAWQFVYQQNGNRHESTSEKCVN
jgi:hypothetical protein